MSFAVHFFDQPHADSPPPAAIHPGSSSLSLAPVPYSSMVGQPTPSAAGLGPYHRAPPAKRRRRGGFSMVSSQYHFLLKSATAPPPCPSSSSPLISGTGLPALPSCHRPSARWRHSHVQVVGCQPMLLG
jgi:hypothetical protein